MRYPGESQFVWISCYFINTVKNDEDWQVLSCLTQDVLPEYEHRSQVSRYRVKTDVEVVADLLTQRLEQRQQRVGVRGAPTISYY